MSGWPSPRRYPRSLAEAFPDVRASWHEGWQRSAVPGADVALAVIIGIGLAVALVHWWAS